MAVSWVMKIASATLAMQSAHALSMREEARESLRAWIGPRRPDFEGRESAPVHISDAGQAASRARDANSVAETEDISEAAERDPRLALVKRVIEMLTGERVRVFDPSTIHGHGRHQEHAVPDEAPAAPRAGFGIEYDYHAVREESEKTSFSAAGVVRTADGREIAFQLDLTMARQYREEVQVSLRAGDARRKDPLVINFDGDAAALSDLRFRFDLDADGTTEEVPLLAPGSGYLALDLNGNGRIDSGAELFGPASGQGFAELAALDQDGNGWLDESDAAFQRLRIWTPAADSDGTLETLAQRQVGALFLGNLATPFELRGRGNSDLGAVRATSLYLSEAGGAGTVQEIDLTV